MKKLILILSLFIGVVTVPLHSKAQFGQEFFYSLPQQFDPDASLFFQAAGITDLSQKIATNYLVTALKSNSLWTLMNAIYPMVGGSLNSCSYNLKAPGLYQITWIATPTASSNGVAFNGTSQYGNTNINAATVLTLNNTHLSYYSRTNTDPGSGVECELGVSTGGSELPLLCLYIRRSTNQFIGDQYDYNSGQRLSAANTNSTGFYSISRTSSTAQAIYKNGTSQASSATAASQGSLPSANLFLGAYNQSGTAGALFFTDRQCAFASVGAGLSSGQESTFYTIVLNFQTMLGRQ